mmetsp:Transcript_3791/g.4893  ORF Transcript_3791/g.4893 Transcript_3791/m.4893 type:complete len:86 (+) Transcript_3791:74-331(+)
MAKTQLLKQGLHPAQLKTHKHFSSHGLSLSAHHLLQGLPSPPLFPPVRVGDTVGDDVLKQGPHPEQLSHQPHLEVHGMGLFQQKS